MTRKFRVTIGGITYNVEVEEVGGQEAPTAPAFAPAAAAAAPRPPVRQAPQETVAPAPLTPAPRSTGTTGAVVAPLPGMVVGVRVEPGQQVNQGDVLLVLEAMKMENDITAPASGTVKEVLVEKGTAVSLGDTLVVIA